jgi:MoaA/NifB/PqqE/SkfB family radical SAM enzyme
MMQRSLLNKLVAARWDAILRGFYEYNVLRHFRTLPPRQLQINVTYRCNARCTMCNIWQMEAREEMSRDQFSRLLDDPLFANIERLTLAGGEPSMRRDLVPLTEVFMDKMPRLGSLTLITNGLAVERILADSRAMLKLCAERGIHFNVSVSLDGVGPVHDEMRNVPGAFGRVERCLAGLKKLQDEQTFWLGAACVITRRNLYHLRELQAWCAERDIELDFQLVGFHETYVANLERRGDLDFSEADREYLFELLQELALIHSPFDFTAYYWDDMLRMYRDKRPRRTPCPFAVDSFVLDAYGDMYYCLSERKIGNCLARGSARDSSAAPGGESSNSGSPGPEPCSAIYYDPQNLAFREELARSACLRCNSGCFVNVGIKKDLKRYLWFLLRRSLGVYPK